MCSVSPDSYRFNRTYRHGFVIPECPKGDIFSSVWIEDGVDIKKDYSAGIDKMDIVNNPFHILAIDIANDYMVAGNLAQEGVWVCESGKPTDEEVEKARDERTKYLTYQVDLGNKVYAQYGARSLDRIDASSKRAAVELGVDGDCEWVVGITRKREECIGCGTQVVCLKDGQPPAYCPICKSVLNVERAKLLQKSYAAINAEVETVQEKE